jgi:hypothetical protein
LDGRIDRIDRWISLQGSLQEPARFWTVLDGRLRGPSMPSSVVEVPLVAYELYEVTVSLAAAQQTLRVRGGTPQAALADVLAHRPGWTPRAILRWAGEGWIPSELGR